MIDLFASITLRCLQALLDASPTLLAGILIALAIRHVFGRERVAGWISSGRWTDLPKTWLIASILPLCAIGVLPVLYELRAARVRPAVLAFVALRGAIWNPLSFAYGLDRLGPQTFLVLVVAASIVVILIALLWERIHRTSKTASDFTGLKVRFVVTDLLVMLAGIAVVVALVPHGYVGEMLLERSPLSFLTMIGIATPTYVSPAIAMMQVDQVLHQSTMPGLMLVTLLLGGGFTAATWSCLRRACGWRAATSFCVLFIALTGVSSVLLDLTIYRGFIPGEDTHAFDSFGQPFHPTLNDSAIAGITFRLKKEGTLGLPQLVGVTGLALVGVLVAGRRWLPTLQPAALASVTLPRWAIVSTVVAGILVGTYLLVLNYFPAPSFLLDEFRQASAEWMLARQLGDSNASVTSRAKIDRVMSRLPMSIRLRHGGMTPSQSDAFRNLQQIVSRYDGMSPDQPNWLEDNSRARKFAHQISLTVPG